MDLLLWAGGVGIFATGTAVGSLVTGWFSIMREPDMAPEVAAPPANDNTILLTHHQRAVLVAMDGQGHRSRAARDICEATGLSQRTVNNCRRDLQEIGLAAYGAIYDDDGALAGRGYWLTEAGLDMKDMLLASSMFEVAA